MLEGPFQAPWVNWVIALNLAQSLQRESKQTLCSTVVLDSCQLRWRVEESSFIPSFIPKRASEVQEAALGESAARHGALAWVGIV